MRPGQLLMCISQKQGSSTAERLVIGGIYTFEKHNDNQELWCCIKESEMYAFHRDNFIELTDKQGYSKLVQLVKQER